MREQDKQEQFKEILVTSYQDVYTNNKTNLAELLIKITEKLKKIVWRWSFLFFAKPIEKRKFLVYNVNGYKELTIHYSLYPFWLGSTISSGSFSFRSYIHFITSVLQVVVYFLLSKWSRKPHPDGWGIFFPLLVEFYSMTDVH